MSTCPHGHQSRSEDWCEVCGLCMSAPAAASGTPEPLPPPPSLTEVPPRAMDPYATVAAERCPNCSTMREGQAAFCEECRYNFLAPAPAQSPSGPRKPPPYTPPPAAMRHLAPPPPPPAPTPAPPPVPAPAPPPPSSVPYQPPFPLPYERTSSRPSQINRPAEPLPPDATITGESEAADDDFLLPPPIYSGQGLAAGQQTGQQTGQRAEQPPTPQAPAAPEAWTAVVAADRDYFTAMMTRNGPDPTGLYFPSYSPEHRIPLTAHQVTIGRRRHSTGESPDIDLSRPPEDPGVSHKHAVLVRRPDGGWSVIDQGSTNGTTVNGGSEPIEPFQPVDLAEGDRVHVGAWTTITLRCEWRTPRACREIPQRADSGHRA
ncbi:MAG: FHA domain-containing protein [Streptomycetaceae bacterium]|nr:FHA domain-containing protein [Streptomycetaceae bacterium]